MYVNNNDINSDLLAVTINFLLFVNDLTTHIKLYVIYLFADDTSFAELVSQSTKAVYYVIKW